MLINILIRTSYRPHTFERCLASVREQTYPNIRIVVSFDNPRALTYIPADVEKLPVRPSGGRYFYDSYCNDLKAQVTEGYFMFLDDDDWLNSPTVLAELAPHLSPDRGLLVQLQRGDKIRPVAGVIESGKVGMPCLIMHHSHAGLAKISPNGEGDYHWIKAVSEVLPIKFLPLIVAQCGERGNGKPIPRK